jgi:hypothetical protein
MFIVYSNGKEKYRLPKYCTKVSLVERGKIIKSKITEGLSITL